MRSEEEKLDHILMSISESVDGISNENFLYLEAAITELLTLRRRLDREKIAQSIRKVMYTNLSLEVADAIIKYLTEGP